MSATSSPLELLADDGSRELLRLVTCGSVDDGKSTLLGRLLYDTKQVMADQLEHVEETSERRGDGYVNLALLTDGLRAEREQGITIDVAYRSFVTPTRRFQLADAPGHVQYTRNMVTGASTADVAVVLLDARKGVIEQTRRHTFISKTLGIPHIVFAVNKMDLVDFDEARFREIAVDLETLCERLGVRDEVAIPIAALTGDNVVERSERMAWWSGGTFLEQLESIEIAGDRDASHRRFPVQWVIRPMSDEYHDYRGYAGEVAGGEWRTGDEVVVLPSGLRTSVAGIETHDGPLDVAVQGQAVVVRLAAAIDVARGDMLCPAERAPRVGQELDAMICWMSERPLTPNGRYALKHTTRWTRAIVTDLAYRLDVNTGAQEPGVAKLGLNDLGRVALKTTSPLVYDAYADNRATGSFILVDEATNATVAAGMLLAR